MLFDSRRQGNLNFKFGQNSILYVDFHKHLGIVFSSDGKWTRHIDYILSKASKQVCVLRKLKFILKREILEKIYLTFMDMPHLICVTYYPFLFVMLPTILFETEMTTLSQDVAHRYTNLRSSRLL